MNGSPTSKDALQYDGKSQKHTQMTSQEPAIRTTRSGKSYKSKVIREESDDYGEDAEMMAQDEEDMAFEEEFKKSAKKKRK